MTLKEKYTIKNKKRIKQFIYLYSILVIILVICSTYAKYESTSQGNIKIAVANWKMALNNEKLTNNNKELTNLIKLIPETNKDENYPEKIKPGQTGYFDIKINPEDTEVSFWYQVSLENSVLPKKFKITSYSLDGGTTKIELSADNTVSKTVSLEENKAFTEGHEQIIRYYWDWAFDGEADKEYKIIANVEVKQVL